MIIDCISDLHGHYPKLEGGDLLIVAGDLTSRDKLEELEEFYIWLSKQKYKHKILIAGNHDMLFTRLDFVFLKIDGNIYLEDSGIEIEGIKIWGSPWSKTFEGINPKCVAFTVDTDEELSKKWDLIPEDTEILITHCPPYGLFDEIENNEYVEGFNEPNEAKINVGSISLRNKVMSLPNLRLLVFGHIHEHGGKMINTTSAIFANCSHVNEKYQPVNKPIRVIL